MGSLQRALNTEPTNKTKYWGKKRMFSTNSLTGAGSGQPETSSEEKPCKKERSTDLCVPLLCLKVSEEEIAGKPAEKV